MFAAHSSSIEEISFLTLSMMGRVIERQYTSAGQHLNFESTVELRIVDLWKLATSTNTVQVFKCRADFSWFVLV